MPQRPRRPCAHPGCPELVQPGAGGRCPGHTRAREKAYDRERGTAAQRGYGARHRRWRAQVLARCPVCADPYGVHRQSGEVVASKVADHIVSVRQGGGWTQDNGQGLCIPCHNRKINSEDGGLGRKPHPPQAGGGAL